MTTNILSNLKYSITENSNLKYSATEKLHQYKFKVLDVLDAKLRCVCGRQKMHKNSCVLIKAPGDMR